MRRKDREVRDTAEILDILARCEVLRLGLCAGGRPYIVPMNFAFEAAEEGLFIYLHCASEGRKLEMMAQNDRVCFEADCSYATLRGATPAGWSAQYESVVGEGRIAALTGEADRRRGLDLLMRRYGYEGELDYPPEALRAVTVLCIAVEQVSGKRNLPGAEQA